MPNQQTRIEIEIDAAQLLRTMIIYQMADDSEIQTEGSKRPYEPGLCWTTAMFGEVSGFERERISAAVAWLLRREYIFEHRGSYIVTLEGHTYYSGCRTRAHIGSTAEFRDEVLLGITRKGQRSEIDNAVLPGTEAPPANMVTPEVLILKQQEVMKVKQRHADELGISLDEFDRRLDDGSLQVCKGYNGARHLGVFNRKQDRWQNLCRECERVLRERGRNKK